MRSSTSPRRTCTRSCTRSTRRSRRRGRRSPTGTRSGGSPQRFSELAERHLGARRDLVAAPLLHDTPRRSPSRWARCATGARASASRSRGQTMPKLIVVERDYPHVGERGRRWGRWSRSSARQVKGASWVADEEVDRAARGTERRRARRGRRRAPVAGARRAGVRGDPDALGDHQRPARASRGSARWSARPGCELADLAGPRVGRPRSRLPTRRCSRGR